MATNNKPNQNKTQTQSTAKAEEKTTSNATVEAAPAETKAEETKPQVNETQAAVAATSFSGNEKAFIDAVTRYEEQMSHAKIAAMSLSNAPKHINALAQHMAAEVNAFGGTIITLTNIENVEESRKNWIFILDQIEKRMEKPNNVFVAPHLHRGFETLNWKKEDRVALETIFEVITMTAPKKDRQSYMNLQNNTSAAITKKTERLATSVTRLGARFVNIGRMWEAFYKVK